MSEPLPLPAALKVPEVSRFIHRANQLRRTTPALAYWCEYHAVNQIVGKNLHTTDDETFNFTKTLIERLEATKTERADDDAIVDNTAGQAYVEQFAQQTFDRAERTLRADKVTRQTADTFDAAATFFDLTHEWGQPDAEILQKIKFAKWNAARILKAIREGKDPNDSNPRQPEPEPEPTPPALDPNDPDVLEIAGPRPVTVEDGSDDGGVPRFVDEPPRPPVEDPGYFPTTGETFAPSPLSGSPTMGVPRLPSPPPQQPLTQIPPQPSPHIPTKLPSQYAPPQPSPPLMPSAPADWNPSPGAPSPAISQHPPPQTFSQPPVPGQPPAFRQPPAPRQHPVPSQPAVPVYNPPPPPAPVPVPSGGYTTNQKDINQAQKHAKWAISALNFEDVPTAVTELRNALAMLGTHQ